MGRRRGRGGGQGNKGRKSKGRKSKSRSKGGASTGRRGGQGNRSKGFGRANSQSKSKSTGGASTGRRGGQGNRNTKPGRAKGTVSGKSIRKAVGRVAKHTNPGLRGLRSVAGAIGGAAKAATAPKKKQSKLQKQFSNFKTRWKAMSTPEAKKQRRRDRLRNQFGLDYDRMNKSFAVDVNVDRAMKHYKVPNFIRNITPGFIKNYKLKKQFYSPTKLGARDGWYRGKYNSTGKSIRSATPAVGNTMYKGPKDTLSAMYQNLLGRDIGQEGLDYWTDELESGRQTEDQVRANILRGSEFKGRSEEDRLSVLDGLRAKEIASTPKSTLKIPSSPNAKRPWRGSPWGIAAALAAKGALRGGLRAKSAKRKHDLQNKGAKRRMAKSIAAHMAAMGGF